MGLVPIPIDISSDEDEFTDWIDELLDVKVDLDDVSLNSLEIPAGEEDSDDDCVILECDPDKPVEVKNDNGGGGGDGSDDLVVVGDKGEIACRDFPHSRHLCVIYPFSTTSHEKHCSLCHCYVCDSLAPCIYWGNGFSFTDHCHATDKVEMWKTQRKSFKATNTVTLPRERASDATIRMISPPIQNSAPIQRPVSVPQPTQLSIVNSLRPCSASSVATPYAPGQRHHQRPPVISSHGQNLSQQWSRSLSSNPGTQCVQKGRPGAEALAHSLMQSSHSKFKRAGTPGCGLMSSSTPRPQYRPSNVNQHRPMPQKPHCPQYRPSNVNQHRPSNVNQHRPMPQKSHYPRPVQVLRSQPQAVTSHSTHSTMVNPQLSQQTTVTSQRSQLSTMSHRTPVTSQRSHPSSTPQRMPVTSQRSHLSSTSQWTPVTSQRTSSTGQIPLCMPVPSQTPQLPVPSQTPQRTPVVQSEDSVQKLEDSVKEFQDILGSAASELDVSGSVLTGIQPYQASSQCPSVGNQIPSQEMGFHHSGPLPTSPDPVDFGCSWLDRRDGENFTEVGEPAVQLSEPVVSLWDTAPEASSIDSLLSFVQQEVVPVVGKEVGLPDDQTMPLYEFGGATW